LYNSKNITGCGRSASDLCDVGSFLSLDSLTRDLIYFALVSYKVTMLAGKLLTVGQQKAEFIVNKFNRMAIF